MVASKFVDEHERHARARLLVIQANTIVGSDVRHLEGKSVALEVLREGRTFGLRRLSGLVLRPSIEIRVAELLRVALLLACYGMARIATTVVVVDPAFQTAIVV